MDGLAVAAFLVVVILATIDVVRSRGSALTSIGVVVGFGFLLWQALT